MPVRVFISHSTKIRPKDPPEVVHPDHRAFLLDLKAKLQAEPSDSSNGKLFETFVDVDNVRAGDDWRKKLLRDGLGTCNAGVVLLNKKAIAHSDWVHTEATILRARDLVDEERCRLIIIFLGQGSKQAFGNDPKWRPLDFAGVQSLAGGAEFPGPAIPASALQEIIKVLKPLAGDDAKTYYEKLREGIEKKLANAFRRESPEVRKEVSRLLEVGPSGIGDLLERKGMMLEPESVRDVIEFIAPWWVDPVSSSRLAKAKAKQAPASGFSLTGEKIKYTSLMYVRQASLLSPDYAWKVVSVTAKGCQQDGTALRRWIVDEVRRGLIKQYRSIVDDTEEVDDDAINELVFEKKEHGNPTFVALANSVAGDEKVTKAILDAFPDVTLLHLTQTEQAAITIKNCEALIPLPDLEQERAAYWAYITAKEQVKSV